jgi:FtsP/CotA-like multicopper oxidase with cupredoxin domain
MHFHGLHVSPNSKDASGNIICGGHEGAVLSSDDVLYALDPKTNISQPATQHQYKIVLPKFHAPGTHWYHPHNHGSTALHIIDGIAGALIIEEEGDAQIPVDEDLVWMLQEIIDPNPLTEVEIDSNRTKRKVSTDQLVYNCASFPPNAAFTVNGYYQPTLTMRPGELHRWRFINGTATPRGFIKLQLVKSMDDATQLPNPLTNDSIKSIKTTPQSMYQIAVDGISLFGKSPKPKQCFDLIAANRSDFLVQLEAGTYLLLKSPIDSRGNGGNGNRQGPQDPQVLAIIQVTGDSIPDNQKKSMPATIPGTFPNYLQPITDDQLVRNADGSIYSRPVVFDIKDETTGLGCLHYDRNIKSAMPAPRLFQVNGKEFNALNEESPRYTPAPAPTSTKDDVVGYVTGTFTSDPSLRTPEEPLPETVQVVKLGTSEQWIIYNYTNLIHPFHIHVNPFQVVEIYSPNDDDQPQQIPLEERVWWDTFGIPAATFKDGKLDTPGHIKINSRFWDYWGEYVFHCHILIHEDLGMMQNVYVANDPDSDNLQYKGNDPFVQVSDSPPPSSPGGTIGDANTLPAGCYPDSNFVAGAGLFPEQKETTCLPGKTCASSRST